MSDTMSPATGYRIRLAPQADDTTCRELVQCETPRPLDGGRCPNAARHVTKEWAVLPVPQYVVPLVAEARLLLGEDGHERGGNVEYERALVEVIARLLPADADTAREVAESLLWAAEGTWIT